MLFEDLRTAHGIFLKKRRVKALLEETAGWCLPGTWHIEGPYARRSGIELPDGLRDSIRGIRTRRASREFVERLLPPWRTRVPKRVASTKPATGCSIAYLSNGGNWKLFDLENHAIWTRATGTKDMTAETQRLGRFGSFFRIPAWRTVVDEQRVWRCDQYIDGPNLAHCSQEQRLVAVRILLRQFGDLARAEARAPDSDLTRDAVRTMLEVAPDSVPAAVAARHGDELGQLGANLKLIPAHGDLSAQNVFLEAGLPWIIDWDTAGRCEPMLYDVLYLILREATLGRRDLFLAFAQGAFDVDIERALASAGMGAARCHRLILLVHAYLVHFHRKKHAGQRDAQAKHVDDSWNSLRSHLRGLC
jgi:hypothetical protein